MIFIRGDKLNNEQIEGLYKLHRSTYDYTDILDVFKKDLKKFYVLYDDIGSTGILGYINVVQQDSTLKIIWIYGPSHGKLIMLNIENHFKKKGIKKITLDCSIDPNEKKETVIRRVNFFFKQGYRVYDIDFRKDYGPLLQLEKNI